MPKDALAIVFAIALGALGGEIWNLSFWQTGTVAVIILVVLRIALIPVPLGRTPRGSSRAPTQHDSPENNC